MAERPRFTPLVGQVRGLSVRLDDEHRIAVRRSDDPAVDPVNTVRDVVGRLSGDIETWWVERDGADVLLRRQQIVGRREAEVHTVARFAGGAPLPTAWDLDLDGTYVHTGLVPARVTELSVRLRGRRHGDAVLPVAESMRFSLSLVVVRMRAAQTIRYSSVVPCTQ